MSLGKKRSDFGYELAQEGIGFGYELGQEIGHGYEGLGQEELGVGYENG